MAAALIPAIVAASVALIVAVLTPAATSLRARRQEVDQKFDAAISALLLVQATRHIASSIARQYHPGTDGEYRTFIVSMSESSITKFIEQTGNARAALAALSPYVPEVRQWITSGWELTEEREPEQRRIIEAGRPAAVKSERLFRRRRPAIAAVEAPTTD